MLTIITTSRRQAQHREVLYEGSWSEKRRADEQKSDTRLSRRVELAQDNEGHEFALHSKSGGWVVTVHALIWGDLKRIRLLECRAPDSNAWRVVSEVSSGHSCDGGRIAITAKDQRNRTGQRLAVLGPHVACAKREVRNQDRLERQGAAPLQTSRQATNGALVGRELGLSLP